MADPRTPQPCNDTKAQPGQRDPLDEFEAERAHREETAGQEGAGAGLGQGGQAHLKDGPDNPNRKR
ncbi:hypothetical protein ACO2Q3_02645 [Caulobacter sp. KR2-114]|uniref:hypothetical protein n=1 Tax=Caulobacter sp. KR2-114 TaxID=3400912 RepID=UPI003C08AB97